VFRWGTLRSEPGPAFPRRIAAATRPRSPFVIRQHALFASNCMLRYHKQRSWGGGSRWPVWGAPGRARNAKLLSGFPMLPLKVTGSVTKRELGVALIHGLAGIAVDHIQYLLRCQLLIGAGLPQCDHALLHGIGLLAPGCGTRSRAQYLERHARPTHRLNLGTTDTPAYSRTTAQRRGRQRDPVQTPSLTPTATPGPSQT